MESGVVLASSCGQGMSSETLQGFVLQLDLNCLLADLAL